MIFNFPVTRKKFSLNSNATLTTFFWKLSKKHQKSFRCKKSRKSKQKKFLFKINSSSFFLFKLKLKKFISANLEILSICDSDLMSIEHNSVTMKSLWIMICIFREYTLITTSKRETCLPAFLILVFSNTVKTSEQEF